ncbi:hypothetical protein NMY22_g12891 [Coprinellus aureogranulatus]|nr:hypothetical protein NMY22_g12891 [Coprinellus aureogranulatus]
MYVHINFQTDKYSLAQLRAIRPWYLRAIDFFYDEYKVDCTWVLMTRYHLSDTKSKNHLTLRGFNRVRDGHKDPRMMGMNNPFQSGLCR